LDNNEKPKGYTTEHKHKTSYFATSLIYNSVCLVPRNREI